MSRSSSDKCNLICDTFLQMMLTKSIDRIKVKDLCLEAGIGRSTFYVYFDSIYSVLQKVEDDFFAGLQSLEDGMVRQEDLQAGNYEFSRSLFVKTLNYTKENLLAFQALCGPYGDQLFHKKVTDRIGQRVVWSLPPKKRNRIASRVCREFVSGGHFALHQWWVFHSEQLSAEELAQYIIRLVNGAIESISSMSLT